MSAIINRNKKRVREIYFYKVESGYKIDLINHRNKLVKSNFKGTTRTDVNRFIEALQENKHTKFEMSKIGIKIYNKKPHERLLASTTETLFDSYLRNLNSLKENNEYSKKVSALLRSVANIIDDETTSLNSDDLSDEFVSINPTTNSDVEVEVPAITPDLAITVAVPMELVSKIQDSLKTPIDLNNLTFYFQNQKWSLTKDGFGQDNLPEPKRPKTSHAIMSAIQYMINLLGISTETNSKIGENSFRFVDRGGVYKINHIYTGDHNTLRREV